MQNAMTDSAIPTLQLDDIQGVVLRKRPSPYVGAYLFLRIDNAKSGRQLMGRLVNLVNSGVDWWDQNLPPLLNVGLTYQGLAALDLPQVSLDSFPAEFQQGMAARAEMLGDTGDSAPARWEMPFGTGDVHVMLPFFATAPEQLAVVLDLAHHALAKLPGIQVVYRQDFYQFPNGRSSFGYKDGIGNPEIEGSGAPSLPGHGPTLKAGEFVLGYPDESGNLAPMPQPGELGRNGTFAAWIKLHTKDAQFRQFLRTNSSSPDEEEFLAAKIMGRWRSGAPLMLAPDRDDPALGEDEQRNNNFRYFDHDPKGLICPLGAHTRRMNPRDSLKNEVVDVNIHRMIRRGTNYGPILPDGVLDDDGADRGIIFIFMGTHINRQFEFVKSQWANDGNFTGLDREKDLIAGNNDGNGTFTIPQHPVRRRLHGVSRFTITRGGEYFFMPGISALRWIGMLDTKGLVRGRTPSMTSA
jgi:Dyp-type peroxidase family